MAAIAPSLLFPVLFPLIMRGYRPVRWFFDDITQHIAALNTFATN